MATIHATQHSFESFTLICFNSSNEFIIGVTNSNFGDVVNFVNEEAKPLCPLATLL